MKHVYGTVEGSTDCAGPQRLRAAAVLPTVMLPLPGSVGFQGVGKMGEGGER